MAVKADDLIAQFETMLREHWAYEWGAAKRGLVDCSGAFVYAYKALGGPSIPHGSNSIFRQAVQPPEAVAKPGYAAFKVRPWTDADASNHWRGTAPGNVYHIGLVDGTGKYVLNAKGEATGFSRDLISGWTYFAPLKAVDYGTEETCVEALYQAVVNTLRDPLRLRSAPETGEIISHIPMGKTVDVLDDSDAKWWRVRYDGVTGYASAAYLVRAAYADAVEIEPGVTAEAEEATTLVREDGTQITLIGRWRVAKD